MGLQRKTGAGISTEARHPGWGFGGPRGFGKSWNCEASGAPFLPRGLGSRRDFAWKKRGERTLAGGP